MQSRRKIQNPNPNLAPRENQLTSRKQKHLSTDNYTRNLELFPETRAEQQATQITPKKPEKSDEGTKQIRNEALA
jgi:hypothetical protein